MRSTAVGFEGEPGLGKEPIDEGRLVLDALSRFLMIAVRRRRRRGCPGAFGRVEVRA